MSGTLVIPLLRRTEINASHLGNGATQSFRLPTIPVVGRSFAKVIVRVHEATWSSGASFAVYGYASYPTPEDARPFFDAAYRMRGLVLQTATLPAVNVQPDNNIPEAYQFEAVVTMSTSAAALFLVVSADLLLRSRDDDTDEESRSEGCSKRDSSVAPSRGAARTERGEQSLKSAIDLVNKTTRGGLTAAEGRAVAAALEGHLNDVLAGEGAIPNIECGTWEGICPNGSIVNCSTECTCDGVLSCLMLSLLPRCSLFDALWNGSCEWQEEGAGGWNPWCCT